jgi:hypothetical protein
LRSSLARPHQRVRNQGRWWSRRGSNSSGFGAARGFTSFSVFLKKGPLECQPSPRPSSQKVCFPKLDVAFDLPKEAQGKKFLP